MLNFSSAAQHWELVGNPFIHDQMFSSNALQLTWTLWPVCRRLQGRWQQPGAGGSWPEKVRDPPACPWLPGFPPASRQGREWWRREAAQHPSSQGPGEVRLYFAALLSERSWQIFIFPSSKGKTRFFLSVHEGWCLMFCVVTFFFFPSPFFVAKWWGGKWLVPLSCVRGGVGEVRVVVAPRQPRPELSRSTRVDSWVDLSFRSSSWFLS